MGRRKTGDRGRRRGLRKGEEEEKEKMKDSDVKEEER